MRSFCSESHPLRLQWNVKKCFCCSLYWSLIVGAYTVVLFDCSPQWLYTANQTSNPDKLNRLRIPPDSRLINYWLFTSAAKELNQKLPGTRRWSEQALKLRSPDFKSDTLFTRPHCLHFTFLSLLSSFASTFSLRMITCTWN